MRNSGVAIDEYTDSLRNYTAGVRFMPEQDNFAVVICRGNDHTEDNIDDIRPTRRNNQWTCTSNSTVIP
ncbi:hypothetical protein [Crocosphaera watsonii]|uniref:hypothetical protein n=1 Tax=Crocosphaera watsonii TaxID=263511 RepID=UPI000039C16F|nr:hypothetical protein [Crocosphaera watsonii]